MVLTGGGGKDEAIPLDICSCFASGHKLDMVFTSVLDFSACAVSQTYLTHNILIFPSHALLLMYLVSKYPEIFLLAHPRTERHSASGSVHLQGTDQLIAPQNLQPGPEVADMTILCELGTFCPHLMTLTRSHLLALQM
jgi:hypothetical protein